MEYQKYTFIFLLLVLTYQFEIESANVESTLTRGDPDPDPKECEGNHFKHITAYSLGKQNDLTLTFGQMQKETHVEKVVYKDELFRTYTIFPLTLSFSYSDAKQTATPAGIDRLRVTGGTLRISYSFNWEKKQLSSSIEGTAKGVVSTDVISFIKELHINSETKELEWNFISADPITITNSLTISEIKPYKAADYDIINEMLNELKSGGTTVKHNLVIALNENFTKILSKIVHENDDTWKEQRNIDYSYSDYHGEFTISYENMIMNVSLTSGLDLMLSKVTKNDSKFECGEKVPDKPKDVSKYGGMQEFISNSFLKSTLRYAIDKGFLDVVLTEEFWQSPAFQFFMGDVQEVIPSTKNMSTLEPITGKCKALDDEYFSISAKTSKTYNVSVNFTCSLSFQENTKKLLDLDIAVDYEVEIIPQTNTLDFRIVSISGTPTFHQQEEYPIKNMELAVFMLDQTLKMAVGEKVIGSGFKTLSRKIGGVEVNEKYLFLYDIGVKDTNAEHSSVPQEEEL